MIFPLKTIILPISIPARHMFVGMLDLYLKLANATIETKLQAMDAIIVS